MIWEGPRGAEKWPNVKHHRSALTRTRSDLEGSLITRTESRSGQGPMPRSLPRLTGTGTSTRARAGTHASASIGTETSMN